MSGYTTGPWNYRPDPYDDWGVVKASNGWPIAKARGGDYKTEAQLDVYRENRTDPYEANARLIAAAPELLELAKAMVSDDAFSELCQSIGEEPSWLKSARAAIAKAESL